MSPRCLPTRLMSGLAVCAAVGLAAAPADAAAVRAGFDGNSLASMDDGSASAALGFNLTFGGASYGDVFVNNNGNLTFGSAFGGFSPTNPLSGMGQPIIAPFFADVDTRGRGTVTYGTGTVGTDNAFAVTWTDVGYYMQMDNKANTFQVVLIDRGGGDFDIEFNYDRIEWEVGNFNDIPDDNDGLGDPSARAGYADGAGAFFELDGSGLAGDFLAGGAFELVANSLNSSEDGRYLFTVLDGEVTPVDDGRPSPVGPDDEELVKEVPEPTTYGLLGTGLLGLLLAFRHRRERRIAR